MLTPGAAYTINPTQAANSASDMAIIIHICFRMNRSLVPGHLFVQPLQYLLCWGAAMGPCTCQRTCSAHRAGRSTRPHPHACRRSGTEGPSAVPTTDAQVKVHVTTCLKKARWLWGEHRASSLNPPLQVDASSAPCPVAMPQGWGRPCGPCSRRSRPICATRPNCQRHQSVSRLIHIGLRGACDCSTHKKTR
jgi:hypothetical protein